MCVIAGYSGNRRAAPILIEMMKKIEYYDGGYGIGIATIHEGKLYYARALGDTEMLTRTTDALDLPGNTGVIHIRPAFSTHLAIVQPFLDADKKMALFENGAARATNTNELYADMRGMMDEFLDRGIIAPSAEHLSPSNFPKQITKDGKAFFYVEAYPLLIGDTVKGLADDMGMKSAMSYSVKKAHERFPTDNITVSVHSELPSTVTIGTISRPMSVLEAKGETFIASVATAFPEDIDGKVTHLPQCSVSQITPDGLEIIYDSLEGVRVEQVTPRIRAIYRETVEKLLLGRKDSPLSIYEMKTGQYLPPDTWSEPLIDCRYALPQGQLKPSMPALYQTLYELHKEGRLHSKLGIVYAKDVSWPKHDAYFTKFWLE